MYIATSINDTPIIEEKESIIAKEGMMNRVEQLLHSMYDSISGYRTQQEISDAIKVLEEADERLKNPAINVDMLVLPTTNTNVKGRKKGVKNSTKRMQILVEHFDNRQKKDVKKKEKDEKEKEEIEKRKRFIEIEEKSAALELKKRKLTLVIRGKDGNLLEHRGPEKMKMPQVKPEVPDM